MWTPDVHHTIALSSPNAPSAHPALPPATLNLAQGLQSLGSISSLPASVLLCTCFPLSLKSSFPPLPWNYYGFFQTQIRCHLLQEANRGPQSNLGTPLRPHSTSAFLASVHIALCSMTLQVHGGHTPHLIEFSSPKSEKRTYHAVDTQ